VFALADITNIKDKQTSNHRNSGFANIPRVEVDTYDTVVSRSRRKMFYKNADDITYDVVSPAKSFYSSMDSHSEGFLPPKSPGSPIYTLVLDLDETLIHFTDDVERNELLDKKHLLQYKLARKHIYKVTENGTEQYFHIRPYTTKLLSELSKYFEIIIFTAGVKEYADSILNELHCSKYISHRLYRQHTMLDGDVYIKDLGLIGRDITKTIIVDNTIDNFMYHKLNGVPIHSWYDDQTDTTLNDLTKILAIIAESTPSDIREALDPWQPVIEQYIQYGERVPENFFGVI
jgi:Dullard-like phosphatase family protein